jgi:hypothetical protein
VGFLYIFTPSTPDTSRIKPAADDTKQYPHKDDSGLISNFGGTVEKLSPLSSGNLQNKLLVLHPQLHRVVVKHKVLE